MIDTCKTLPCRNYVVDGNNYMNNAFTRLLPPTNEVYEGYVFTPVCQSFCSRGGGGESASVHAGIADTPPAQCMLGDTANKRAVRILLE